MINGLLIIAETGMVHLLSSRTVYLRLGWINIILILVSHSLFVLSHIVESVNCVFGDIVHRKSTHTVQQLEFWILCDPVRLSHTKPVGLVDAETDWVK